jgi:2OG-Fe(II) oxygenase superfamily
LIRLTRAGVVVSATDENLEQLRLQFARDHYLVVPRLIDPELLDLVARRVEAASYQPFDHKGIALELCMDDADTVNLLDFLINRPKFLQLMERLMGIRHIGSFGGRVYRMTSTGGHYDSWHRDFGDRRLATLSLNLTREEFGGGALQMRYCGSDSVLHGIRNTGFGDALLFRISRKFQHRVMPVEGNVAKVAYAGWFRWGRDYHQKLRRNYEIIRGRRSGAGVGLVRQREGSGLKSSG